MMKTKSLFVNVAISLAILSSGIVIGKFLLSPKPEPPKKNYIYFGEIERTPLEPLGQRVSNYKHINRVGVVPDAATAYEIANAVLIDTYGKDKIDYSESFSIQLRRKYMWTVGAVAQNQPFWFYEINIDKRDGCIFHYTLYK